MEPNQDNKTGQPVDNKTNQPIAPEVKKEETNSNPANQVNQSDPQEKKVQPAEPIGTDGQKISDTPDTKEPQQDDVKGEAAGDAAPTEENKG